ncbi:MAG: phosphoglycerate dehydrogenase [Acidimicrobiia bacterium]
MRPLAVSPRSFRQVAGRHQEILAASGLTPRYPSVDRHLTEAEMIELVAGCEALIVGIDPVTARVLDSGPVQVVAKYGSGLDNIDLRAAEQRGVKVASTPGANSQAVAELTLSLLFALARRIVPHHTSAMAGRWDRHIGVELTGRRLGLIGLGQVGGRVARMARAMGMEVVAHDPYVSTTDVPVVAMNELVSGADAVSLHVPLTEETRQLVDASFLAQMRPGSYLINTARFGLADIEAVADALASGHLAGAAFDDFGDRPDPGSRLWDLPGFLASPHAGASTVEAVERTGVAALEIVLEALVIAPSVETRKEEL